MEKYFKKYYNNCKIYSILLAFIMIIVYNISIVSQGNHIYLDFKDTKENLIHKNITLSNLSNDNNRKEYIEYNQEYNVDEFGNVESDNKVEFLSNKNAAHKSNIAEAYKDEYAKLNSAVLNHEKEYTFNVGCISKSRYECFVKDIWDKLRSEDKVNHNVIFKPAKASGQAVNDNYENVKISFGFDYNVNKTAEDGYKKQIKNIATTFKNCTSDLEKANAINEYLLNNAKYALAEYKSGTKFLEDGMSIHSPYTILVHKKGVCTAYAELFKLMADEIGLETKVVVGQAFSYGKWGSHEWNIVKIDGKWYHLDASWNKKSENPESNNRYFLVGSDTMSIDHQWVSEYFPTMSNTDHNHIMNI